MDTTESPPRQIQTLDASRGDLETMLGLSGGRFTRVAGSLWVLVAAVLSGGVIWALSMFPEWEYSQMIFRCWTNSAVIYCTILCLLMLGNKLNKCRIQEQALKQEDLFPRRADFVLSPATARDVLDSIRAKCDRPREFLLFNRIMMALSNLGNLGEVRDVGAVLESQGDADANAVHSSYTTVRSLIWVMPVLGFIGTVVGLSVAIGSFQGVLESAAGAGGSDDASQIKERLTPVVLGLRTAFETTLIALLAAVAVQLISTFVYRREEDLLDACTQYCNDHVISRLRLTDL